MRDSTQNPSAVKKKPVEILHPVLFENSKTTIPSAPSVPVEVRKAPIPSDKEAVYSGVASGPYKRWHDEWLATPEGQAVERERLTGFYNGFLDWALDQVEDNPQ